MIPEPDQVEPQFVDQAGSIAQTGAGNAERARSKTDRQRHQISITES
ncbi:MAG: hypothetical protein J7463_12025 [Roseiflexus sp.]|nr:hypothetical protein [Roseiflexus sp.]